MEEIVQEGVVAPKSTLVLDDGHIEAIEQFLSPEQLYEDLIKRVRKYHPSDDISMIEKGYQVASEAHKDQRRRSGEPYIIHPLCVAIVLADLELDKETIVAGLLHDVVEDTVMTKEALAAEFGEDVAELVDGVTKLQKLKLQHTDNEDAKRLEMQAENFRKMFLAMAKDIRVILIKLADRLHNMRTLEHQPPEKQQRIARETIEIYAPIAQRLGISKIKVELDDLSLRYLQPEVYFDLVDKIAIQKTEREKYIRSIVEEVSEHIKNAGIEAKIDGRVKHFFSIYKKMKNQNKTLDQIYDLFAVRIIVESVKDCYAALGVIHAMYKPMPGRFKDYIAMPKENMYQSLHTTLLGSWGQPFEIQIRTYEMHKAAEYGIAAHWKYKEASDGKKVGDKTQEEEKLAWLRQILEWQRDMSDNKEFMNILKSDLDLFSDTVYCFTPTGEVKNLPFGSTPIDFAYCIHSQVGHKMVGAKVNGKLVTIDYEIKNGDCVEIMTNQNSKGPSRDWLNVVKSTQAKNKIAQFFKSELKEENILKGKEMIQNYCKMHSINPADILKPEYMEYVMHKYGLHDWDSLLAAVGHGGLREAQIINRMLEQFEKQHQKNLTNEEVEAQIAEMTMNHDEVSPKSRSGIVVKGIHDLAVRFSKCCNPVPGDTIVGFVTRGRGITIHRADCINMQCLAEEDIPRLIDAEWQPEAVAENGRYMTEIVIYANNRNGFLADISRTLTESNIDIRSLNTRTSKQGVVTMSISFEISGKDELTHIIDKLRNVPSVVDIERTSG